MTKTDNEDINNWTEENIDNQIEEIAKRFDDLSFEIATLAGDLQILQRERKLLRERETSDVAAKHPNEKKAPPNNSEVLTPRDTKTTSKKKSPIPNRDIQIGDRVRVTNKYKGRKGATGVVIATVGEQVLLIQGDHEAEPFQKYRRNVERE